MATDSALLALLHELDDPRNLEWPEGFDREAAAERFERLRRAMDEAFRCTCTVDAWPDVQDASYFGRLVVPAAATASGGDLVVVISNFWPLAMVALENPGAYEDADLELLLEGGDRALLERVLDDAGHVMVPERLLDRPYDGSAKGSPIRTWLERYFDYL